MLPFVNFCPLGKATGLIEAIKLLLMSLFLFWLWACAMNRKSSIVKMVKGYEFINGSEVSLIRLVYLEEDNNYMTRILQTCYFCDFLYFLSEIEVQG